MYDKKIYRLDLNKLEASPYTAIFWDEYHRDRMRFDYHIMIDQTITGELSADRLNCALEAFIHLSPLFNSHLAEEEGHLFWVPNDQYYPLEIFGTTTGQRDFCLAPFSLECGPLYRSGLFKREDGAYDLFVILHHALIDGSSIQKFIDVISDLYNHQPAPEPILQSTLDHSFQKMRKRIEDCFSKGGLEFWSKAFTHHEKLPSNLPYIISSESVQSIGEIYFEVDKSTIEDLIPLKSTFQLFLNVWGILMSRCCNQHHLVISFPMAIREGRDLSAGAHINMLLYPFIMDEESTYESLDQAMAMFMRGLAKGARFVPTANILEVAPVSHLNLAFCQTDLMRGVFHFDRCQVTGNRRYNSDLPKQELILEYEEGERAFNFRIRYRKDLFGEAQIKQLGELYRTLLFSILQNPTKPLRTIPLLNWNESVEYRARGGGHVIDLFLKQAELHPDRLALSGVERKLTYRILRDKVERVSASLSLDVPYYAVRMERSVEAIIAMLAVLKTGSAFVPIDPSLPEERVEYILNQLGQPPIITREWVRSAEEGEKGGSNTTSFPYPDIAYVMFTSGTTGKPKGVVIEEASLVNFIQSMIEEYQFTEEDVLLQFSSLSFDVSILEIFSALFSGAQLAILDEKEKECTEALSRCLIDNKVTFAHLPPALLPLLNPERFPDLRLLEVGGEQSGARLAREWMSNQRAYYNSYGPTETTVTVSIYRCSKSSPERLPIGKAIAGHTFYILDQEMHLLPIGVEGDLYVSGPGLAKGYLNEPELTAQKFIPNPFGKGIDSRMYKTGDRVRLLECGNIEFLGRADDQIKIRGYRIELSEIEASISNIPGVNQGVVLFHEERLVAYFNGDESIDPAQIENSLSLILPHYMLPSAYTQIHSLPLTPNGKIDKKKLIALHVPTKRQRLLKDSSPRTPSEFAVYEIWRELLKIPGVGLRDNFFHVGGNSILALQLVKKLNDRFNLRLKSSDIIQNKTIESLALCIKSSAAGQASQILTLQEGDGTSCIICIHPAGGTAFCYSQLTRYLSPGVTLIGIQAKGVEPGESPIDDLVSMASSYCELIKGKSIHPPYVILGWSFGGAVAFEMASQLHKEGIEASTILLDTAPPVATYQEAASIIERSEFVDKFFRFHGEFRAVDEEAINRFHAVYNANIRAFKTYAATPFLGKVTLFKCGLSDGTSEDKCIDWSRCAVGEFVVKSIQGEHWTLMDEPFISEVASKIEETQCY